MSTLNAHVAQMPIEAPATACASCGRHFGAGEPVRLAKIGPSVESVFCNACKIYVPADSPFTDYAYRHARPRKRLPALLMPIGYWNGPPAAPAAGNKTPRRKPETRLFLIVAPPWDVDHRPQHPEHLCAACLVPVWLDWKQCFQFRDHRPTLLCSETCAPAAMQKAGLPPSREWHGLEAELRKFSNREQLRYWLDQALRAVEPPPMTDEEFRKVLAENETMRTAVICKKCNFAWLDSKIPNVSVILDAMDAPGSVERVTCPRCFHRERITATKTTAAENVGL